MPPFERVGVFLWAKVQMGEGANGVNELTSERGRVRPFLHSHARTLIRFLSSLHETNPTLSYLARL